MITSLCDADPVLGAPESLPEYHTEAKVYVPNESIVNLVHQVNDPMSLSQTNVPFLQGEFFKCLFSWVFFVHAFMYVRMYVKYYSFFRRIRDM